ncbi:BlaI/MecI/CopY family transcriptional regulator [Myxococcus sp. CA051A]|uniref:BlaI/MecI/CopY family transcriptional regulator n=1 Tax=Myxococcus llanfairpwllgwyngyllgogerychwyrndrobwllllantysiliogogogochensis TaxID=2590453 RepID=A0A540WLP5_9BACT|nr:MULTISPECIES: BlaI/MecI/CopY family transcriptional regulator [Myxococcus]NTX02978.1 BlaI/MecI/CopY family transcriptional regulator [Myxococcus sp. CA040A]NTX11398.1 BlaI/MecI/CopY family transcriptional regulator [Myxococcus sp. CA056]NTX34504.1 BlaI/MecI/CopY family transcriptional regulator [Myxococcus sp. CA033]NTX57048.1 BlaI/MecI/CopY family transcriptional regulator [Myxococcus sp. CA039A]NTX60668.1 BlaI/MecI/CopY family transcriptional regulator [Myxococcus sp. CA051A]
MKKPVGEQELSVLRYVAEHGPATVGEVVERFGEPQGLARSTILTVMERLRLKGYLTRRKVEGVFQYASPVREGELLRDVVGDFVQRTLSGSLSPFAAYLSDADDVSDKDLAQLQDVVARLRSKKRKE